MTTMNLSNEPRFGISEDTRLRQAIDHTKLTFASGENETDAISKLCQEAREARFFAVCIRPRHIRQSKASLSGSSVKTATVIGFPLDKVKLENELKKPTVGNFPTPDKVAETREAVSAGADELDLVINVADLKSDVRTGTLKVKSELKTIRGAADGRLIKVIIETDLLTPEEIVAVTRWCVETGMGMVKTSTGMVEGGQGATLDAVRLIRDTIANAPVGIKASGGVKNRDQALRFLEAGVSRIGTSSGLAIVCDDLMTGSNTY